MIEDRAIVPTRLADLDTQRHVTSRTYEMAAWQGRYQLLLNNGFTLQQMYDDQTVITPVSNYCKFYREQQPPAQLNVHTRAYIGKNDQVYWLQEIYNNEKLDDLACRVITMTKAKKAKKKFKLFEQEPDFESPKAIEIKGAGDMATLLKKPKAFNGSCKRVVSDYNMLFSERGPFFTYAPGTIWRIFEEGRWAFGTAIGFGLKQIQQLDTTTFFTGATYHFAKIPEAGSQLKVYTWVEKVDKIRCFLRQDVTMKNDSKVLMSIREEQLIVSPSKRRPKKAPKEWMKLTGAYTEK